MPVAASIGSPRGTWVTRVCRSSVIALLVCGALALSHTQRVTAAQDKKTVAMVPAPSAGKAVVCIYRLTRVTGAASRDDLYINRVPLATLQSGEYAFMEVAPGPVVVSGLPSMSYGGALYSSAAALNELTKKENERARIDVEAGKTYYLKWTAGPMGSGITVTLQDPSKGAREMSTLHLSKPPKDKDNR